MGTAKPRVTLPTYLTPFGKGKAQHVRKGEPQHSALTFLAESGLENNLL